MVLMGPRQVGKTTLAFDIAQARNSVYLDLERPSDLAKISDIEQYCALNGDSILSAPTWNAISPSLDREFPLKHCVDSGPCWHTIKDKHSTMDK